MKTIPLHRIIAAQLYWQMMRLSGCKFAACIMDQYNSLLPLQFADACFYSIHRSIP
jgi:hypothetical protein